MTETEARKIYVDAAESYLPVGNYVEVYEP